MDLNFLNKINKEISEKFPLLCPIETVKADGTVNRFDSTKINDNAIWVCVHQWEYKGNIFYKAIYGSWRAGVQYEITSYSKKESQNKEFYKHEKQKYKETQKRLETEKLEKYKACKDKWEPIYHGLYVNSPLHDYLKDKKINSNFHARVTKNNLLLIPGWNSEGIFIGGQRILLDPVTNEYEKKFTWGIDKLGSFCPFGDIRTAEFIYICEGFATAASVYMAFLKRKNVAVACIWDTSNILTGAQAVRRVNQNSFLIFAADKDISDKPKEHNIGERKAVFASNKLSNAIVRTVKFESGNSNWSDYNDLHQFEGLDKVMKQLNVEATDFIEIIPLGFNGSKYFYFSSHKKQILEFTKADHNPSSFLIEAPARYWGDRYGYIIKADGEVSNNPNWKIVVEKLGLESARKGPFNCNKIRGVGAWEENGDVIVNLGDRLYYKGEFYPLHNNGLKSDHFYQSSENISLDFNRPLGNSDCLKFVEAYQMLNYKNKNDFIIALGWVFSAQIFAALPWRPHIWFTGPRGCGKSHILNYVDNSVALSILTQGSSAPGIRQRIKNNAIAIISDESEPNTEKDRQKLAGVLELARQCSTRYKYETLMGTASGDGIIYNTNSSFCMGSIQLSAMGGADTSRFFVLEMNPVDRNEDPAKFTRLENAMNEIPALSVGLFIRAVNMYSNHIKNIKTALKVIKEKRIEARQADQLAPIIAGYYAYFDTGLMPESFVINTIKEIDFEHSDYAMANEDNDSDACLNDVLELQIPARPISVGQILEKYLVEHNNFVKDDFDQMLGLIGLRFYQKSKDLFVSSNSSALKRRMEASSKYSDYLNILKRHKNYSGAKTCRVAGKPCKGILVNIN